MRKTFINLQDVRNVSRYEEKNPCWHTLNIEYNDGKCRKVSVSTYEGSQRQYHNRDLLDKAYEAIKEALMKNEHFVDITLPDL